MNYIDIHGHINFPEYEADREEVVKHAKEAGVGIIVVGTDLESSKRCVELAEKHEEIWAVVGMHPSEVAGSREDGTNGHRSFNATAFKVLAQHPKVVAIGECGLDYFHSKSEDVALQKKVFIQHIELANEVSKPLMLHLRNADRFPLPTSSLPHEGMPINAYQEAIQILKEHAKVPANFHFFAGTMQDMNDALAIGCSISFTGVITFARNYDELIKVVPLDKIMTETDCPYVTPIPYRGKRNEPAYVTLVVKQMAKIRGESEEIVAKQVLMNAKKFFKLS